MLLEDRNEDKKQLNVKIYNSIMGEIEDVSKDNKSTVANFIRHSISLALKVESMKNEINKIDQEYELAINTVIDNQGSIYSYDELLNLNPSAEEYETLEDDIINANHIRDQHKLKGYAIREKYSDIIEFLPTIPVAPCPF